MARLMGGAKPILMVTDPPYGVEYDPAWRGKSLQDGANRAEGAVTNDDVCDWREAWALFPGDVVYCWTNGRYVPESILALEASGFGRRVLIVWGKTRLVFGRGHYHSQEEECWYAVRKGATGHWCGDHSQTTLWQIEHLKSDTGHGTQKPVECMARAIRNHDAPQVYDPFVGSGTTIIAAEMTGRACYALEISEIYCDVSVERFQKFSGKQATLDGDGRTFEEIAHERVPTRALQTCPG